MMVIIYTLPESETEYFYRTYTGNANFARDAFYKVYPQGIIKSILSVLR